MVLSLCSLFMAYFSLIHFTYFVKFSKKNINYDFNPVENWYCNLQDSQINRRDMEIWTAIPLQVWDVWEKQIKLEQNALAEVIWNACSTFSRLA